MSELFAFVQLGFRHITDLGAMDHILFLLALAAIYRPRDWRSALWVVTAFTVGHSFSLALAVTGAVSGNYRPVFAGVFGLVHGAGFANYLRDLFQDQVAGPLFGFNVGIEIGQIVVLCIAALVLVTADRLISAVRTPGTLPVLRLRILAVSSIVLVIATRWAVERNPW